MTDPARPWWAPRDWATKLLVTGLFVSVASLVVVVAWSAPLKDMLPTTVVREGDVPEDGSAALLAGKAVQQYPFLKQATERATKAGGTVETLLPRHGWEAWLEHVETKQALADPTLVAYEGVAWRFRVSPT